MVNEKALLLPLLFFTTVYLFCIRAKVVDTSYYGTFWYASEQLTGDLYGYFRMQLFVGITILFSIYMLFCILTGGMKLQKHKVYIPMAIYAVLVIVSYAFAEYKNIAFLGANSRYEGTLTLLCYMLILFYTMHAIRSEGNVKCILKGFGVASFLLGIWGICQVMGVRLSDLPTWLYVPADLRDAADISLSMDTNAVNWFFTNQNYTSFFMVFPICLFGMACIAEENGKKKLLYAVLTGLMLFCLWQAASLGGMVGLAVAVVAALLIAGKNIVKWRKSLGLLFLAGVISVGASLPVIMREVKSGTNVEASVKADAESLRFAKIDHIITDGADIVFSFEGEEVRVATEKGEVTAVTDTNGKTIPADNDLLRTSGYIDEETGYHVVAVETANKEWLFIVEGEETYYVTQTGKGIKLDKIESMGFENSQGFATNRGYIWSRTLPLLKDTLLFGKGADTYALYFPQDDYVGRYNIGYYREGTDIIVDKPHNMYLGTAVHTGVISMIALLVVYAIYLIESIKIYRKHTYEGFMDHIGMGIFIAIAGYLVAGLVNDSTVQMMPMVYIFLGMGFAINRMLKEKK